MRADRLKVKADMLFMAQTQLESIISAAESEKPEFIIVDSIQTMYKDGIASAPGSVTQVRECAAELVRLAKGKGIAVFIIGHVTKEGAIAGPRVLEHLVDTVLYFEGERHSSFRILRAVKNRFGSTNEIGVFEMTELGMKEVENPSAIMISQTKSEGACVYCGVEGTRPVLLEIEALVSESAFGNPRRMATGIDYNRMSLIVAVLEKKIGLKLYNQDIFVNVSGGMKLVEPASDLAVAASIVSSFRNTALKKGSVFMGEIALTGELRQVSQAEKRLSECARMGMNRVILPAVNKEKFEGVDILRAATLFDALVNLF